MLSLVFLAFGFLLGIASMASVFLGREIGGWAGQWLHVAWLVTVLQIAGMVAGVLVQGGGVLLLQIPAAMLQGTERDHKGRYVLGYVAGALCGLWLGFFFIRAYW